MKSVEVRYMWLFVFFDLPVGTKAERRAATRFRNFLKDDGFLMLQWSVYARVCRGDEAVAKHDNRTQPDGAALISLPNRKENQSNFNALSEAEPTTGKSAGKPRLAQSAGARRAKPTTGKSAGKPRLH
jgi:CRISPR-associated endonuclease Cas2